MSIKCCDTDYCNNIQISLPANEFQNEGEIIKDQQINSHFDCYSPTKIFVHSMIKKKYSNIYAPPHILIY